MTWNQKAPNSRVDQVQFRYPKHLKRPQNGRELSCLQRESKGLLPRTSVYTITILVGRDSASARKIDVRSGFKLLVHKVFQILLQRRKMLTIYHCQLISIKSFQQLIDTRQQWICLGHFLMKSSTEPINKLMNAKTLFKRILDRKFSTRSNGFAQHMPIETHTSATVRASTSSLEDCFKS